MVVATEWTTPAEVTDEVRATLNAAQKFAAQDGAAMVGMDHLLLGLLHPPSPAVRILLANLRVDVAPVVARLAERLPSRVAGNAEEISFDEAVVGVFNRAAAEARTLGTAWLTDKHVLLGFLSEAEQAGVAPLRNVGLTSKAVRAQLRHPGVSMAPAWRDVLAVVRPSPVFLALIGTMFASGAGLILAPMSAAVRPLTFVFILSGWIASVCVHEFGHALAGYFGGDRDLVRRGLLTLDPRRYIDSVLSIALPIMFFLIGGIPLPGGSVWIDRRLLHSERWAQIVSAGGPLGTLFCLILVSLPFLLGLDWIVFPYAYEFWSALAGLGQLLAIVLILNLLPIPPLDGFQLIARWLPPDWRRQAYALGWAPMFLFFIVLSQPSPLRDAYWSLSYGFAELFNLPAWIAYEALDLLTIG